MPPRGLNSRVDFTFSKFWEKEMELLLYDIAKTIRSLFSPAEVKIIAEGLRAVERGSQASQKAIGLSRSIWPLLDKSIHERLSEWRDLKALHAMNLEDLILDLGGPSRE